MRAYILLVALFGAAEAAVNPCTTHAVPTPAPTPGPTIMIPAATPAPPPKLIVQPVCVHNMTLRAGAFEPWHVYRYLKVNTAGFVRTPEKDIMGGQTLTIMNANIPMLASQFQCVHEDNEWKARVRTQSVTNNILTMLRDNGISVTPNCPSCAHIVSECLLQDISLYRTMGGMLGLRLDYGHCPLPTSASKKKAFIMVGLKRVPNSVNGAANTGSNLRGFFKGVCESPNPAPPGSVDEAFDLTKANDKKTCFWNSADMEDMEPLDPQLPKPCFHEAVAYSMYDVNNKFGTIGVRDTDYDYLLSKLPVGDHVSDDPCKPVNQAKKIYGYVTMDRVCIKLQGINCETNCGKWCNSTTINSATTSKRHYIPPPMCIDCEMHETLYAIVATLLVVVLTYHTYLSTTLSAVATWFYVPLGGGWNDAQVIMTDISQSNMPNHHETHKNLGSYPELAIFATTGLWSGLSYYFINILDWAICRLCDMELCIRLFPWQYTFSTAYYNSVNGTALQKAQMALSDDHRGRWIWGSPSKELNIDVCCYRLLPLIIVTWFSAFALFWMWRKEQKVTIMRTLVTQTLISEEEGFGGSNVRMGGGSGAGAPGMLTKTLAFLGGGYVPP